MSLNKYTIGFGLSAAVTIVGNTILTWVKEENAAVAAAMKSLLWHHWIAHGIIVVAAFVILGFLFSYTVKKVSGTTLAVLIVGASVVGALGLIALFLFA